MRTHTRPHAGPSAMELLAPAGSLAAFEAALAEGADAVYVGAPVLNARAMAKEFSYGEIGAMIRQAHRQGKKLYIAMNSLVKETEVRQAVEALSIFARLGPDALIIQDLGLLYLARYYFPDLPLHASTLMSVHNSLAARRLVELGFERVVLARELTLDEIGQIAERSEAELEIFVHGAMCFSYSGLCLFSSLHGGRSSLRGQCVQPCRRRYSWQSGRGGGRNRSRTGGKGGYLFSMNDLCGIDLLPTMQRYGVASLKIEGRLRSVQYVRRTVAAYRLALDSLDMAEEQRQQALAEAHHLLDEAMGRRRSSGYFLDSKPKQAVSPGISGNTGQLVGRVERMSRRRETAILTVRLKEDVAVGDRLRLHDEQSGERQSFTLHTLQVGGRTSGRARAGTRVGIVMPTEGSGKGKGSFNGFLFRVDIGSRRRGGQAGRALTGQAAKIRITPDRSQVEEILDLLGWRSSRSVRQQNIPGRKQGRGRKKQRQAGRGPGWWVRLRSLQSLGRRLPVRPARILVPLNRENVKETVHPPARLRKIAGRLIWCLPPVIQEERLGWFQEQVHGLIRAGFSEFQLGHCSQQALFPTARSGAGGQRLRFYGDYTLNILNSMTLGACRQLGFAGVQFSLETDRPNLTAALADFTSSLRRDRGGSRHSAMQIGLLVYGRPPLFTARLEAQHFRYHQPLASPRGERFLLDHDEELTHARADLPFSLLQYRDELQRSGLDYLVLDLSGGPLHREVENLATLMRGSGRMPNVLSGNYSSTLI